MRAVFLASLPAFLLVLVARADAAEIKVEGKHVLVTSTSPHRPAAERCRDVIESAIAVYEKNLPYKLPEKEKLVFHLYATHDEYAQALTEAKVETLIPNDAATINATNESHIVIQPRADEAYLELVSGLSEFTCFLCCHEGVHQFVRRAGAPRPETWPSWYSEGMADTLAELCLVSKEGAKEAPICIQDKRSIVKDLLAGGSLLGLERVLVANSQAFPDIAAFYAHAFSLYGFLARDRDRLRKLHDAVDAMDEQEEGANATLAKRKYERGLALEKLVLAIYGPLDDLEKRWRESVKKDASRWREVFRSSQLAGDELICAGFPGSGAIAVATSAPLGAAPACSFEMNIVDGEQADVCLAYEGRPSERFLKIALGSKGYATLLGYSDGSWQPQLMKNVDLPADTFPRGKWVRVRLVVEQGKIRLDADGKRVFDADLPPTFDASRGRFGVGAWDSVVRFRKLKMGEKD